MHIELSRQSLIYRDFSQYFYQFIIEYFYHFYGPSHVFHRIFDSIHDTLSKFPDELDIHPPDLKTQMIFYVVIPVNPSSQCLRVSSKRVKSNSIKGVREKKLGKTKASMRVELSTSGKRF